MCAGRTQAQRVLAVSLPAGVRVGAVWWLLHCLHEGWRQLCTARQAVRSPPGLHLGLEMHLCRAKCLGQAVSFPVVLSVLKSAAVTSALSETCSAWLYACPQPFKSRSLACMRRPSMC